MTYLYGSQQGTVLKQKILSQLFCTLQPLDFGRRPMLQIRIKTMFQDEEKSQSSGKRIMGTFTELDLTGKTILKSEAALPLTLFEKYPVPESFSFKFLSLE